MGALVGCGASAGDGGVDPVERDALAGDDAQASPETSDTAATGDADTATDPSGDTGTAVVDVGVDGFPIGCELHALSDLNLRAGPSTSTAVLDVIPNGDPVTVLASAPQGGFYNVRHAGLSGWASGNYLDKACASTTTPDAPDASATSEVGTVDPSGALATIEGIAVASSCYKYAWKDRGQAPRGYVKGVADVFARAVCNPSRTDVVLVSKARTTDDVHDVLAWYATDFAALGMSNDVAGVDTLRHTYALLLGLGMRESSGEHCCGRDMSATNVTSDSSEAGAWQTSYDSHTASTELPKLFAKYRASTAGCLLDTFKDGVTCSAANWQDWGSGIDGLDFQRIEKSCPAFAAEYAAVMLRVQGGRLGHYGPLRTKAAEIRPECDAMLQKVQATVQANPAMCAGL
jgi:uncharacterized protein YraI